MPACRQAIEILSGLPLPSQLNPNGFNWPALRANFAVAKFGIMPFSSGLNPRFPIGVMVKKPFYNSKRLKDGEVKILLKNAKKISGENFVLYPLKNHLSFCRLAISISKRTVRLSTKRNLLRRRIKAAFLHARKEAIIDVSYDILVVVRRGVFSYQATAEGIFNLLKQIK